MPARPVLGQRALELPTVLVTNQHSLSDAEDFTEGYRALKLGKVVGEPTAGWIIYTCNITLIDGSVLRLPRSNIRDATARRWRCIRGRSTSGRAADWRELGARDAQLDKAVEVLLAQIGG